MNDNESVRETVIPVLRRPLRVVSTKVIGILRNTKTGAVRKFESTNIVTNAGDLYYAQRGVNDTPTNFTAVLVFDGIMELYNGATPAPVKTHIRSDMVGLVAGSGLAMDGGYPMVNDLDALNTGKGADVVTYKRTWAAGVATATGIVNVVITNPSPTAGDALLMHSVIASTDKGALDELILYVNHTMNGT
tara:strand:- start:30340 stop:30909 length:570 start_codon:yes stop_codon:yes gene_type:complete